MKEPVWLNYTDCLAIHEMMLAQHGGFAGVRDEGLLKSALTKPQNLFACSSPTFQGMAASYAAGIILNHPFLDGNKRTGFMVAVTFLELNGLTFTASEEAVVEKALMLAAGKLKETAYALWLSDNCRKSG